MLCLDNPFQTKCRLANQTQPSYAKLAQKLTCADFYNSSDNKILWWQALQREATFEPEHIVVYLFNHKKCRPRHGAHFYIEENHDFGWRHYINWSRGHRLRQPQNNGTITACLIIDPSKRGYAKKMINTFLHCLRHYGEGLKKYLPVDEP